LARPLFDPALGYNADGPFAGVPFSLGSRAIRGAVAREDHDLMARFRAAGLVALGQRTAPEFGLSFATEPVKHGPTRNPWGPPRNICCVAAPWARR
jgi:amidase